MRKVLLCLLVCALLFGSATAFSSCKRAPKIDAVRDELIALIEASYEINTVFFGPGLPVYDRSDPVYADLYNSLSSQYANSYSLVDDHAKFSSINEIKAAASLVYSPKLLEENLFVNAFVGYALPDAVGNLSSSPALFAEALESDGNYHLFQSDSLNNLLPDGQKIYDYSTMKIVRPSKQDTLFVTLSCCYASDPDTRLSERLRFVNTSSGWRLDSFTV